jgi:hypothetical protein
MKKACFIALLLCTLFACRNNDTPDVSGIKVDLTVHRLDKDFFTVDTNQLMPSLQRLGQQYPFFLTDYFQNILGLPPLADPNSEALPLLKQFIRDYQPIRESVASTFANTSNIEAAVKQGLQFTKYYFPNYKTPSRLIFYIGPMDAYYQASLGGYADVITEGGIAVGLQLHLGSDYPLYNSQMGQQLYPTYISRRFTPAYIPVNCIKNVIDDLYPEKIANKVLVEQMVEKGKRLYILDKLMPTTPDTLKIGYTDKQLKGCYDNEGKIWSFFLTNSMLMSNDPSLVKNYMGDAPNTQELGPVSPGYIGLFVGWQIVKKYMSQHKEMKLPELLNVPAMKLFEESKYKPK